MPAILNEQPFEPLLELANHESMLRPGSFGACANFIGTMRDFNAGSEVSQMTLEHYPAMTQQFLDTLCQQTMEQWELIDCLIIHRFGIIHPGDPIVLTAAWSAHRDEAFTACRHLMEELKKHAPFWKKEQIGEEQRWVHDAPSD